LPQRLGLEVRPASDDDVLDVAIHHRLQVVASRPDAVIRQTILREVVRPDLLAAVAGADLSPARRVARLRLRLQFHLVHLGAQQAYLWHENTPPSEIMSVTTLITLAEFSHESTTEAVQPLRFS